jgi:OOP family OmpA-OmpF porin
LGKNANHSDWVTEVKYAQVDPDVLKRINTIEKPLNDTDKDGVVDYLDLQNNTPSGITVDTKRQYIDTNKNRTPDELEPEKIQQIKDQNLATAIEQTENSAFKSLLNNGLVNVFYDVNKDEPNNESTNSIFGVISLMKKNPSINIKLVGYSDRTGIESKNQELSEQRVKKLFDFIVMSGIDSKRIKIIGQGVDNSISSNSKIALQLARRVSILLE